METEYYTFDQNTIVKVWYEYNYHIGLDSLGSVSELGEEWLHELENFKAQKHGIWGVAIARLSTVIYADTY